VIFCHICCSANQRGLVRVPKHPKVPFIEGGFSNWKKALERFKSHEKSVLHRGAVSSIAMIASGANVVALQKKNTHRLMLVKLLHSIRFLARQGLPLRGHKEDAKSLEGNLVGLCNLCSLCTVINTFINFQCVFVSECFILYLENFDPCSVQVCKQFNLSLSPKHLTSSVTLVIHCFHPSLHK